MMIMPANNSSGICHYFAGKHPGSIGMLYSPQGWTTPPYYMPYALDNGCFTGFEHQLWRLMLRKVSLVKSPPLWCVVPDEVGDAEETMRLYHFWHKEVLEFGYNTAFACQDGMEPQDVPDVHCCFIGGTTEWKLANGHRFKGVAEKLHIGRVNTPGRLQWASDIGADSVDGTGFFRGSRSQYQAFVRFIDGQKQLTL